MFQHRSKVLPKKPDFYPVLCLGHRTKKRAQKESNICLRAICATEGNGTHSRELSIFKIRKLILNQVER